MILDTSTLAVFVPTALLAGTVGARLRANVRFWRVQRYFAGSVFIALGVAAGLMEQGRR